MRRQKEPVVHALVVLFLLAASWCVPRGDASQVPVTASPGARLGHAMAFAPPREGVILVAGALADRTALADTWLLKKGRWTRLPAGGLTPRVWPGLTWDSTREELVLFGGRAGPGSAPSLGDTWVLRDRAWVQRLAPGPSARDHAHLAYDEQRGRVVMFGGWDANTRRLLDDTWEWDGRVWTAITAAGPSPRAAHGLVWDAGRKTILLFGGRTLDSFHGDTWTWNGRQWSQVAETGPSPRGFHAMFYDYRLDRVIVAAGISPRPLGDAWSWDGRRWSLFGSALEPPRSIYAATWDPIANAAVLHGGGHQDDEGWRLRDETWYWSNGRWTRP